jgi:hypothetical protein
MPRYRWRLLNGSHLNFSLLLITQGINSNAKGLYDVHMMGEECTHIRWLLLTVQKGGRDCSTCHVHNGKTCWLKDKNVPCDYKASQKIGFNVLLLHLCATLCVWNRGVWRTGTFCCYVINVQPIIMKALKRSTSEFCIYASSHATCYIALDYHPLNGWISEALKHFRETKVSLRCWEECPVFSLCDI